MKVNILKYAAMLFISITLVACQSTGVKHQKPLEKDLYVRAQNFLAAGDVMKARAALYALKNTHEKYPQAMAFLKNKVEPLRLKQLKMKKKEGKEARWQGRWQQALSAYQIAESLALGDQDLEKKVVKMQAKVYQNRFDSLMRKRNQEDDLLKRLGSFYASPPKGLAKDDAAYVLHQKRVQQQLKKYASDVLKQAEVFLKAGYPEAAYAEMSSYFRLNPKGSRAADKLFVKVKKAMPTSVRLPNEKKSVNKGGMRTAKKNEKVQKPKVTTSMIEAYILKEEWVKATHAARLFKKQGGDADEYLALILSKRQTLAKQAYELGRQAFLQEKLGSAVAHWQVAVRLMPDNKEYKQSLGRATRLKKRLKTLKDN